jgi:hypothetical protein
VHGTLCRAVASGALADAPIPFALGTVVALESHFRLPRFNNQPAYLARYLDGPYIGR